MKGFLITGTIFLALVIGALVVITAASEQAQELDALRNATPQPDIAYYQHALDTQADLAKHALDTQAKVAQTGMIAEAAIAASGDVRDWGIGACCPGAIVMLLAIGAVGIWLRTKNGYSVFHVEHSSVHCIQKSD